MLLLVAAATIWLGGDDGLTGREAALSVASEQGHMFTMREAASGSTHGNRPVVAPLTRPPQADKLGFAQMAYLVAVAEAANIRAVSALQDLAAPSLGSGEYEITGEDTSQVWAGICSYSWSCDWATATVMCESRGNHYAHGHEWYQGQLWHFLGWWQIAVPGHEGNDWLYDGVLNTEQAHQKYVSGGTRHWPNCP